MNKNTIATDFTRLRELTPYVKYYVLLCSNIRCTNNYQTVTTSWSKNKEFSWLIDLKCTKCKKKWSICSHCSNVKTGFDNTNQVKQHNYT